MKVKLILSMPAGVDLKTTLLNRLPNHKLIGYRGYIKGSENSTYSLYECNVSDIKPVNNVIDSLKKFGAVVRYQTA